MQKTLEAIIGENPSAAIKMRTVLQTISTIQDVIDVSYKLNTNVALKLQQQIWNILQVVSSLGV